VAGALTDLSRQNSAATSATGTTDRGQADFAWHANARSPVAAANLAVSEQAVPQVGDATARTAALDAGAQQPAENEPEPSVIPTRAAILTEAARCTAASSRGQDAASPTVPALAGSLTPPAPSPPGTDAPRAAVRGTSSAAAPPAEQLGKVLIVATATQGGNRQLTVRLDPPELGHVRIAITQPHEGGAAVTLTVERPETLLMVLRDEPALHRALDRAGVPADARTVSFELAPQREAPTSAQPQPHVPSGSPALDMAGRDHGQRPSRPMVTAPPDPAATEANEPADSQPAYVTMWCRAGIDITA
jgi:flagellar hook-length control protein FliK